MENQNHNYIIFNQLKLKKAKWVQVFRLICTDFKGNNLTVGSDEKAYCLNSYSYVYSKAFVAVYTKPKILLCLLYEHSIEMIRPLLHFFHNRRFTMFQYFMAKIKRFKKHKAD